MEPKTIVVNLFKDKYDVYIGRPGKGKSGYFGNPFPLWNESERTRILNQYRKWFYERLDSDEHFKSRINDLKGKRLGCFCKPKDCHGDIIAEYLNSGT